MCLLWTEERPAQHDWAWGKLVTTWAAGLKCIHGYLGALGDVGWSEASAVGFLDFWAAGQKRQDKVTANSSFNNFVFTCSELNFAKSSSLVMLPALSCNGVMRKSRKRGSVTCGGGTCCTKETTEDWPSADIMWS
jgi:hypothetical protein